MQNNQNMINIIDLIEPTVVPNVDQNGFMGNPEFNTEDRLFIRTAEEGLSNHTFHVTNYAKCCGVVTRKETSFRTQNQGRGKCWTRPSDLGCMINPNVRKHNSYTIFPKINYMSDESQSIMEKVDYMLRMDCEASGNGIVPSAHFNLNAVLEAKSELTNFGNIKEVKSGAGATVFHAIELGYYPKSVVKESENFESAFQNNPQDFVPTGKKYNGFNNKNGDNIEFSYQNNLYVRAENHGYEYLDTRNKGFTKYPYDHIWFKVEPISWEILNWDEMPKEINPDGKGTAQFIDAQAENIIMQTPYISNNSEYGWMYQNSTARCFLNSIDSRRDRNRNGNYRARFAPNMFAGCGFLEEAFVFSLDLLKENNIVAEDQLNNKMTKCTISNQELTGIKNLNSEDKTI